MRERKGVDLDGRGNGEESGGEEEGETVFRVYCMRRESMFSKREIRRGHKSDYQNHLEVYQRNVKLK